MSKFKIGDKVTLKLKRKIKNKIRNNFKGVSGIGVISRVFKKEKYIWVSFENGVMTFVPAKSCKLYSTPKYVSPYVAPSFQDQKIIGGDDCIFLRKN